MISHKGDSLQNCSPADDDTSLLCAHHELAGDGRLEAETVDAGREVLILAVARLHLVLAHRLLDVPVLVSHSIGVA